MRGDAVAFLIQRVVLKDSRPAILHLSQPLDGVERVGPVARGWGVFVGGDDVALHIIAIACRAELQIQRRAALTCVVEAVGDDPARGQRDNNRVSLTQIEFQYHSYSI